MDDKLNILSIKVPFQFKVASIIAADQVEILGTTIVRSSYFKEEDNNILIPKVGLSFEKAGTYIIESNFNIKIKKIQ